MMQDCRRIWQKKKKSFICEKDFRQSVYTIKLRRYLDYGLSKFIGKGVTNEGNQKDNH